MFLELKRPFTTLTAIVAALLVASITAPNAMAGTIDFEFLAHGEIATTQQVGVTISGMNPYRSFDYAIGFDTTASRTADDDLEAGGAAPYWAGGNLANAALGTILILQENSTGCGDGICNVPDDEGGRPAGELIFDFDVALVAFGFDVVDVESATAENGMVFFFVDADNVPDATVAFVDFVTNGSQFFDPTIAYGNRTANHISPMTASALGIGAFDRVAIRMGGSGGVDNLDFTFTTTVPEPTTAALLGLGLVVAGAVSRRTSTR